MEEKNKDIEQEEIMPSFVYRDGMLADKEYVAWLANVKARYRQSQIKASVRVNTTMLEFYWSIGRDLVRMRAEQKWGTGVVKQFALDMRQAFPNEKGFSYSNVKDMKRWYLFYYERIIKGQQVVGLLELGVEPISCRKWWSARLLRLRAERTMRRRKMEDNKQENPQKPVVVYGVVNIGCDQTGATFQTLVEAPKGTKTEEVNQTEQDNPPSPLNSISPFTSAVIDTAKADAVIALLRQLMEGKTKPKDVLMPVRAAMEAGVIRRPTWEEFCQEFESYRLKSKTSFSDYTNPDNKPYTGADFQMMKEKFRQLMSDGQ